MKTFLMNKRILGCTPQTYKPCTCQSSRQKSGPGVSNRDINGLTDRGAYMPGPRSWRDTPPCAEHFAADSFPGGEGGYQSEGELTSGWLTSYQRNQQRAHPLPPAIKLSWQSCSDPKLEHPYIYLKLPQQLISYNPIKHRKFKV